MRKISKGKIEELNKEEQKEKPTEKAWVIALDMVMLVPVTNKSLNSVTWLNTIDIYFWFIKQSNHMLLVHRKLFSTR